MRIAFLGDPLDEYPRTDKNAWIWTEGETPVRLTDTDDAAWVDISDDGTYVAFTRQMPQYQVELWSGRVEDGEGTRLVTPGRFAQMGNYPGQWVIPMDLHWVPGTHTIGFHTNLVFQGRIGFVYTPDNLWWVDAETGKAAPKPVDGEVFYSPDGALAAVVNGKRMLLMNADGTGQRTVAIGDYHTIPMGATYSEPPRVHWAGDSRSVLVIAPETDGVVESKDPGAMVTIWKVGVEDAQAVRFARYNADYSSIAFSPDHQWVAYRRNLDAQSDLRELHIARTDGAYETVSGETASNFTWSPDSRHFIYWSKQRPFLGSICADPIPLMKEPPKDPVSGELPDTYRTVWIDAARYVFAAGSYGDGILYRGDISDPAAEPRRVMDYLISMYDVFVMPNS